MRSKAQSIIKESNKVLGNLTDKQIERYCYDSFTNEQNEQFKNFTKKGGEIASKLNYENGTGLFGMSENKKKNARSNGGKVATSRPEWKDIVVQGGKASAKSPKHPNNTLEKCIHCGFKTTLPLIRRWHGDNCKHKK